MVVYRLVRHRFANLNYRVDWNRPKIGGSVDTHVHATTPYRTVTVAVPMGMQEALVGVRPGKKRVVTKHDPLVVVMQNVDIVYRCKSQVLDERWLVVISSDQVDMPIQSPEGVFGPTPTPCEVSKVVHVVAGTNN